MSDGITEAQANRFRTAVKGYGPTIMDLVMAWAAGELDYWNRNCRPLHVPPVKVSVHALSSTWNLVVFHRQDALVFYQTLRDGYHTILGAAEAMAVGLDVLLQSLEAKEVCGHQHPKWGDGAYCQKKLGHGTKHSARVLMTWEE